MFSSQLKNQSRQFFIIAFGLASVISSSVWGEEALNCLPYQKNKVISGQLCKTNTGYTFLQDNCDPLASAHSKKKCHDQQFDDANGKNYWTVALAQMQSGRNSNRFAADNCSQGQAVGYQNKWVTYQCKPENNFYSDKSQNFYHPLVSVLFNVEPVYIINQDGSEKYRSAADPISMSGSVQVRTTDNVAIQTCTNNLVKRISNPVISRDYRKMFLLFDGSHRWECDVQTGNYNLGESRLRYFNEKFLSGLGEKYDANLIRMRKK